jgi:hypothetical protein
VCNLNAHDLTYTRGIGNGAWGIGKVFYVVYVFLITNTLEPIPFKPPQTRFVGAQCGLHTSTFT